MARMAGLRTRLWFALQKNISLCTDFKQLVHSSGCVDNQEEASMFSAFFTARRKRRFHWKPAVDLTNPRIAAALSTFSSN